MRKISLLLITLMLLGSLLLCSCGIAYNYVFTMNEDKDGYCIWAIARAPVVSITGLYIPSSYGELPVTEISSGAFSGWNGLINVSIPASIEVIGTYAFGSCETLSRVSIEGVERIEACAFANCPSLERVTLPESLEYIGEGAFGLCSMLSTIVYNGTIDEWHAIEKAEGWYDGSALSGYFAVSCTDGNVLIRTID